MIDYLNFDVAIICSNDFSEVKLRETFDFFVPLGIKNFIFLYDFDFDLKIPSDEIKKIKLIRDRISFIKPKGISVKCYFNFVFSSELNDNLYIRSMTSKVKPLFVQLPAFYQDYAISATLNNLLYKQKKLPIFTGFEKSLVTSPTQYINELVFKATAGVFALDFNFLTSTSDISQKLIYKAMRNNIPLVICFSNDLSDYAGFEKVLYNYKIKNSEAFLNDLSNHLKSSFSLLK